MTNPQLSAAWRIEMVELSYTGVMLKKIKDEIEAPLRAELAKTQTELRMTIGDNSVMRAELTDARLERDNIASLNSSLIAKIAEAMDRLCYTAGECDLVTACEHWVANFHETEARAKRAEAERYAMREALEGMCNNCDCLRDMEAPVYVQARAALAPPPAEPDGKSLAVLYCMDRAEAERDALREALEPILRYYCDYLDNDEDGDPNTNRHVAKARAALKISGPPSPK